MAKVELINKFKYVGTRPNRPDGLDKVTGRAKYGADFNAPNMLHAAVLRSPHAHARIVKIDTSKAEGLSGVKAFVTRADFPTGLKGEDFKSAMGDYALSRSIDDNLKSVDDFAGDKVYQTNVIGGVNPRTGEKAYDKDFARAVTLESQGDTVNADTTFICTVLFEMNILPMSIYKYDQRYGQQVNRRIYNGYALWGKPLAERIRKQGLTYKIITPIACAWAEQMAYDLSDGKVGKNRISIKIGKFLGETICYALGLFIKPRGVKNGRTHTRNRQHGTDRRTVHGKNGVPKGRGRPRIKRRATN